MEVCSMNLGMMDEADVQYEAWTRSVGLGTEDEMDIKDEVWYGG